MMNFLEKFQKIAAEICNFDPFPNNEHKRKRQGVCTQLNMRLTADYELSEVKLLTSLAILMNW